MIGRHREQKTRIFKSWVLRSYHQAKHSHQDPTSLQKALALSARACDSLTPGSITIASGNGRGSRNPQQLVWSGAGNAGTERCGPSQLWLVKRTADCVLEAVGTGAASPEFDRQ